MRHFSGVHGPWPSCGCVLLGVTKAVKSGQYRVKKSVKSSRERIVVLYRVLRESKHRVRYCYLN